jgi:hypothetical protein
MTLFKTLMAAALVLITAVMSASAQLPYWGASNPDMFQAQYPDRDVLNGGALTPAGKTGLERPGGAYDADAASNAYARMDRPGSGVAIHRKSSPRVAPRQ